MDMSKSIPFLPDNSDNSVPIESLIVTDQYFINESDLNKARHTYAIASEILFKEMLRIRFKFSGHEQPWIEEFDNRCDRFLTDDGCPHTPCSEELVFKIVDLFIKEINRDNSERIEIHYNYGDSWTEVGTIEIINYCREGIYRNVRPLRTRDIPTIRSHFHFSFAKRIAYLPEVSRSEDNNA